MKLPAFLDPTNQPLPANITPEASSDAFRSIDGMTVGTVDTLYANAGTINQQPGTVARRELANENPWSGAAAPQLAKLTHFRAPGQGDAMWSGQCVYDIAGVSPSFSYYEEHSSYAKDDGLTYSVTAGLVKGGDRLDVQEPTSTRSPRVSAHMDSAPAAAFFQGYFNPHWSGLLAGFVKTSPRPLHANFNPNQMGSKELNRATQYQPVPPMGSIVGYFGTQNEKAL